MLDDLSLSGEMGAINCTGEIVKNNRQLLLNMTFLKQQVPLLTSPMIWKIVGKAASIYSGSLIKR